MFRVTTIRESVGRAGRVFEAVQRQPSWAARLALGAMLVVLAGVVLLLVVPALLIGALVFLLAAAAARLARAFGRPASAPAPDERENVRVIPPTDDF